MPGHSGSAHFEGTGDVTDAQLTFSEKALDNGAPGGVGQGRKNCIELAGGNAGHAGHLTRMLINEYIK
jgi:hypothetical protein